ncbi:unnamed protein product [Parajaminaea phylloscopi]
MADGHRDSQSDEGSPRHHQFHIPNAHPRGADDLGGLGLFGGSGADDGNKARQSGGPSVVGVQGYHSLGQDDYCDENDDEEDGPLAPRLGVGAEDEQRLRPSLPALSTPVSSLAVFVVLGAAVLLPFNTLVTPTEYYRYLFASTRDSGSFLSWMLLSYNVSTIVLGAHATVSLYSTTPARRILISSATIFVFLLGLTLLTAFKSPLNAASAPRGDVSPYWYYGLLLGSVLVAGSTAYLQNAVVALCSIFGAQAMGLMLTGQGAVGAVIAGVQLAAAYKSVDGKSTAVGEDLLREPSKSDSESAAATARAAASLFGFSVAFMAFAMAAFAWLARSRAYKSRCRSYEQAKSNLHAARATERQQRQQTYRAERTHWYDRAITYLPASSQANARLILEVQEKIVSLSFALFWIFAVTLSVYPSLTARVVSVTSASQGKGAAWQQPLVFVAWHMIAFNVSDVLGRSLPSITSNWLVLRSRKWLVAASCARTLFIPLFLACNVRSKNGLDAVADGALPDWVFFSLVLLFGLTNGFTATSVFIAGPESECLVDEAEKATAGAILSFWLTVGLAVGSAASFAVAAQI